MEELTSEKLGGVRAFCFLGNRRARCFLKKVCLIQQPASNLAFKIINNRGQGEVEVRSDTGVEIQAERKHFNAPSHPDQSSS